MKRIFTIMFGVLLLANLAVLLWPDNTVGAAHVYAVKEDVNPHFVRLNKEIEDKYLAAQATYLESGDLEADDLVDIGVDDNQGCYRLGPFMHKANYELAQAVLYNADVDYQKSTRTSRESNMYRVYLGPYSNQPQAADMRVVLRRKKVLDHFVRKESNGQYIVSLGIYSTKETAENAVKLFKDRIDAVKSKSELVFLPNSYWLHFAIEPEDQIQRQLASIDWGEQAAKLGKYQCLATG